MSLTEASWAVEVSYEGAYELDEDVLADGSKLDEHFSSMGGWIASTLVRLGDLISLAFCTGSTTPEHFREWTVTRVSGDVQVSPSTAGVRVPIAVPARRLEQRQFASDADLRSTLAVAEVVTLQGHACW